MASRLEKSRLQIAISHALLPGSQPSATMGCHRRLSPAIRGIGNGLFAQRMARMQATVAELAALVAGKLIGDGNVLVRGAAPLAEAGPGDITLVDRPERSHVLASIHAAAVVGPRSLSTRELPVIQVEDVHQAFTVIMARFRPPRARHAHGDQPAGRGQPHGEDRRRTSTFIRWPRSATTWRSATGPRSTPASTSWPARRSGRRRDRSSPTPCSTRTRSSARAR